MRFCLFDLDTRLSVQRAPPDGPMTLARQSENQRHDFPALNDSHLLSSDSGSDQGVMVWKARTHCPQEIFHSASRPGWLGPLTTQAQFANQDHIAQVEQFELARAQTHIGLAGTAPGASLRQSILDPG